MEKAMMIDFTAQEYINSDWRQVVVRGIKFAGEYDVDIYYKESGANYSWRTVQWEHVDCKRLSTINKRLAAAGFTCKID